MEITIEKIELVKDRTGVSHEEAEEALKAADGNVVDAIISLEDDMDSARSGGGGAKKDALVTKMKEIVKKGNISKITIARNGENILNIPLTVGILGTVIAPWGVIAGTVAAMGFKCDITFTDNQGKEFNLSEKAGNFCVDAKEKTENVCSDIKEKAPAIGKGIKELGEDILSKAKDKAENVKDNVENAGLHIDPDPDVWEDMEDIQDAEYEDAEPEVVFEDEDDKAETEK